MILTDALALAGVKQTLWVLLPEFLLIATATAMMTAGAFVRLPRRAWSIASAVAFLAALVALVVMRHTTTDPYSAVALNDPLSGYARLILILTGLILLGLAHDQVDDARAAEFFGALLMIHAGGMLVAAANEMVFLFAGLELVSIPTYLLLYLPRRNATTQEAATKYFFLSIFSSALLLFGLAYLYGLTGVTNLRALAFVLHHPPVAYPTFGLVGVLFVMAGLGFRVAAVPFHFYAPDVYQGSPTVVAALLAWVPKAIGFVAMIRVLTAVVGGVGPIAAQATILAWIIAAATMTLGNAVALQQEDLKRLLAYSSIAHAGYLMIGVTAAFRDTPDPALSFLGGQGILFYLLTYSLMTLGAFGVIIALNSGAKGSRPVERVEDLAGLIWTRPALAAALAVCLFSLAGVPPLAGFLGKFWIFAAALAAEHSEGPPILRWLAILGVLNAAIGAYYYLRIVVVMVFRPAPTTTETTATAPPVPWPTALAVGTCASLSLLLLPIARPILAAARDSAAVAVRLDEPPAGPRLPIRWPPPPPPRRPRSGQGDPAGRGRGQAGK